MVKLDASSRLTVAADGPARVARTNAMDCLKDLYIEMKTSMPKEYGNMPDAPLQNSEDTLKRACKAGLKADNRKVYELARRAYGYLIAAGVITPF